MGRRMLRGDNWVRPRRQVGTKFNSSEHIKSDTRLPIFKLGENDFIVPVPSSDVKKFLKEKPKKKGIFKYLQEQIETFCEKTTLHGLRYVGDKSLTVVERIFWLIAFTLAIIFASYYISNIYDKWRSSPVIISFSPSDAELTSIPFPSVTICNMNQAKKTEAEKLIAEGDPVQLRLLNDVCNGNKTYDDSSSYNWTTLSNFLIRAGNSCSDMLKQCEWSSQVKSCDEMFNNDLTDEGLCCSFNRLPPNKIFRNPNDISLLNQTYPENVFDWNPETGFNTDVLPDDNFIPRRPLGAGAHLGLTVVLDAEIDNYYCSSTNSIGFKVLISNPIETPKMADFGSLLSPGLEARYSITPSVREASNKLRDIALKQRQCYFANEKRLQYYRKYSKQNCLQECSTYYMFKNCKCVPYYLPKNKTMRYCEQDDDTCIGRVQRMVYTEISGKNICKCLSSCHELSFSEQITLARIGKPFKYYYNGKTEKYLEENMAILHIFFSLSHYNRIVKNKLYDNTDFVGNVGGLLSAFLGFGILSIIELIYLMIIKSIWIYYDKNKKPAFPFIH